VDLPNSELPEDVEIIENDQGRFEARRRSEPSARFSFSQPTPELARLACLTNLNARAALDRVKIRLAGTDVHAMTREQYEHACAEVGVIRLPDSVCASLESKSFDPPKYDTKMIVTGSLARYRGTAILAAERRQHQDFALDLPKTTLHGLSRERYDMLCDLIGAEPAAEERINSLKVECFQQEKTGATADLPLILAKWRDTGRHNEQREA
jgi:hypothetical protein